MRGRLETSSAGSPHRRFLVADDEPAIRALLAKRLRQGRYSVDAVPDGEEAWQAIERRRCDSLIVDLRLPRVGGQEFWERLKIGDARLARRIIFVTGEIVPVENIAFVSTTGYPLIEKTFDVDEVRQQVRRVAETESADDQYG